MESIKDFIYPVSQARLEEQKPLPSWLQCFYNGREGSDKKGRGQNNSKINMRNFVSLLADYKTLRNYIDETPKGDFLVALDELWKSLQGGIPALEDIIRNDKNWDIDTFVTLRSSLHSASVALNLIITRFGQGSGINDGPPSFPSLSSVVIPESSGSQGGGSGFVITNCHTIAQLSEGKYVIRGEPAEDVSGKVFDGSDVLPPPRGMTTDPGVKTQKFDNENKRFENGEYIRVPRECATREYGTLIEVSDDFVWIKK